MPKQRKRASHSERELIERISSPQTPADLQLALQYPSSPVYKRMINNIMLGEVCYLVTEESIRCFLIEKYEASEREKAEIETALLAAELAALQRGKQIHEAQLKVASEVTMLAQLDEEALKKRLDKRSDNIDRLLTQNNVLAEELDRLRQETVSNTHEWREYNARQIDEYQERLIKHKVEFVAPDGRTIAADSIEGRRIIKNAFKTPAPATILEKVGASWQQYNKTSLESNNKVLQETAGSIPAPPPTLLPADFFDAGIMAAKNNVLNEIRLIAQCAGNTESAPDFLKAAKLNRAARKQLPGTELKFNPGSGRKNEPEKDEQHQLLSQAINNYHSTCQVKQAFDRNAIHLLTEKQLQDAELEAHQKRTGKDFRDTMKQRP